MFKQKNLKEEKTEKKEYKILNMAEALEVKVILGKYKIEKESTMALISSMLERISPDDFFSIINLLLINPKDVSKFVESVSIGTFLLEAFESNNIRFLLAENS